MKLSKESQYGLTGVLALAELPAGSVLSVAEIAAATGLAQPFLAKVFQRLARGGVLQSHRGRSQGYALARPQPMAEPPAANPAAHSGAGSPDAAREVAQ